MERLYIPSHGIKRLLMPYPKLAMRLSRSPMIMVIEHLAKFIDLCI